ncbi:MAG: helix-turn-helix transcriptional regulator [Deltaproteobacteria bacterium]|nr:helix-turn-helix transcriptional regulator [Deltaproteobacteria bacterium]
MFLASGGLCFLFDPLGFSKKEEIVVEKSSVLSSVVASVTLTSQPAGVRLHWDGRNGLYREIGVGPVLVPAPPSSFQAMGQPSTTSQAEPYWTTANVRHVSACPSLATAWEQAAACTIFSLDPLLLANPTHEGDFGATGELVWVYWGEQIASCSPSIRPVLRVRALYESTWAEHITIVPSLTARDPLLRHIALMLQAQLEGKSAADRLYAEVLANALAVHFLKRYAASRHLQEEISGGLSPYKLRRTTAYIREHLTQELSLVTLAAVGETSPAHFARLFKHTTGHTPHQYVIMCRMDQAKQLLAETDASLSEVGLQVGCADQSHFTALFRKHVSMTPKAYRDTTKTYSSSERHREQDSSDT